MRQISWCLSRAQDAAEKADVLRQSCREDSHLFMGLMRVKYSPMEAAKMMPEAFPVPGLYTSSQNLRSQLTSEPAVLQCQSRGKRWKDFCSWGSLVRSESNVDVLCWKPGLRAVRLAQKRAQWLSHKWVLRSLKEPLAKVNRFNIKATAWQSSLARFTLVLTRWLKHTEEKQQIKSQSQSTETKIS